MSRIRILPYNSASKSAKALAEALGGKRLRLEGSTFVPRDEDAIINWGSSNSHPCLHGPLNIQIPKLINDWEDVSNASNKLEFFELMRDTGLTPQFWTTKEEIPDDCFPVVCRTVLSGHSGVGIVIAFNRDELVDAPLYVKYIKKQEEYRVHVGRQHEESKTIAVQRKARRLSVPDEEIDWQVRNLAGGFIYQREGFTVPSACEEVAHDCLRATGLDFGAVDVIWNNSQQRAYVLEVNTAPGLEGSTVDDYANFFKEII